MTSRPIRAVLRLFEPMSRTAGIARSSWLLCSCAASMPPPGANGAPVFFQSWSADLDPGARKAIGRVAVVLKATPTSGVWVVGYADRDGSAAANRLLSRTRAQVVMDQLILDGVDASQIHQVGLGGTGSAQHAQEGRRVMPLVSPV